jgi:hypothetical protein
MTRNLMIAGDWEIKAMLAKQDTRKHVHCKVPLSVFAQETRLRTAMFACAFFLRLRRRGSELLR